MIYSSGPDAFEYVFQNNKATAVDFLKYVFVKNGGEFSYDNHYSVYLKDKMIGIGSIFNGKRASGFVQTDALNILKFYGLRSMPVIKHGLKIEKIIVLPAKDEIAVAHLAIDEKMRGKGIGTFLINQLISNYQGNEKKLILDVSEENPRAKELYLKMGFTIDHKVTSNLKNRYSYVPHHFRMSKSLMLYSYLLINLPFTNF